MSPSSDVGTDVKTGDPGALAAPSAPGPPWRAARAAAAVAAAFAVVALFGRRRAALLRLLRRLEGNAVSWPPPPRLLVRRGGPAVVAALVAVVLWTLRGSGPPDEEDAACRAWVDAERRRRGVVLGDLLRRLRLGDLCAALPRLRPLVLEELEDDEAAGPLELSVSAESVSEAAEKLVKIDRRSPRAWRGYAAAAALTAVELQRACEALSVAADIPAPGGVGAGGAGEADALSLRVRAAEDMAAHIQACCPTWQLSRQIVALYDAPLQESMRMLRARRRAQWQCVVRLLWRFRSALPYIALSSALSIVLGAFSAMRHHYQAAVINLAKDATIAAASAQTGVAIIGAPRSGVGETVGAMVVSEVVTQLAEFVRARLNLHGKAKVVQKLKVSLFEALLRQDLEYLEQVDLWQLRSLIGSCGTTIGQVLDFPAVAVESSTRLIAALAALGGQSGSLTAFLAVVLPLRLALGRAVDLAGDYLEQRCDLPDFRGQINSCWGALTRPASLRTMRAFAREPFEVATFARFLAAHDRLQEHGQLVYRLQQPVRALLENGAEIAVFWYGGRLALRGELAFGELASVVLVAQNAFDGARFARAAAANVSAQALGPLAQMASLLAQRPRIGLDEPPYESMPDPAKLDWSVTFEGVSFSYPTRPGSCVLKGLSFAAKAGEFLGVLGTTGAGKSTIFVLLLRFYEPAEGRILLGGRDLRSYNPLWLRRHIGIVSQDLVLCQRTIHENLLYGVTEEPRAELPDAEARGALRVAQCEETFFNAKAFPGLWHTDVGESGSDLSGGEKQRLAVARAVLKKPRLLLLDEATSALDELSQARLQDALEDLRRREGLTVICVAHRLSNLAKADRLVVVSDGHAAEEGTPSELLAAPGGVFAEYARAHRAAVQAAPPPAEAL